MNNLVNIQMEPDQPKHEKFHARYYKKQCVNEIEYLFAEDQGRYIIEINKKDFKKVADILNKNAVHFDELGAIIENKLYINDKTKVTIDELSTSNKSWLIDFMNK